MDDKVAKPADKPRRTRVRTGCWTCKARRRKCDETKPICNNCRTTGRVCQGYGLKLSFDVDDSRNVDGSSQLVKMENGKRIVGFRGRPRLKESLEKRGDSYSAKNGKPAEKSFNMWHISTLNPASHGADENGIIEQVINMEESYGRAENVGGAAGNSATQFATYAAAPGSSSGHYGNSGNSGNSGNPGNPGNSGNSIGHFAAPSGHPSYTPQYPQFPQLQTPLYPPGRAPLPPGFPGSHPSTILGDDGYDGRPRLGLAPQYLPGPDGYSVQVDAYSRKSSTGPTEAEPHYSMPKAPTGYPTGLEESGEMSGSVPGSGSGSGGSSALIGMNRPMLGEGIPRGGGGYRPNYP